MSIHKVLLEHHSHTHWFTFCLSVLVIQQQNCVEVTEAAWHSKLKICTVFPFTGSFLTTGLRFCGWWIERALWGTETSSIGLARSERKIPISEQLNVKCPQGIQVREPRIKWKDHPPQPIPQDWDTCYSPCLTRSSSRSWCHLAPTHHSGLSSDITSSELAPLLLPT